MLHANVVNLRSVVLCAVVAFVSSFLVVDALHAQPRFFRSRPTVNVESGLLNANGTKSIIDLNGRWQYRLKDESEWKTVAVPSSWEGNHALVYRREFDVPSNLARTHVFQLVALSVSYYCEISINGQFVGKHAGLTSFSFKLTPGMIKSGRNTIEVHVHNNLTARETMPAVEQLWDRKNYGGIVHDIAIVAHRGVWVQESYVRTSFSGEGRPGTITCNTFLSSGELLRMRADTAGFGRSTITHVCDVIETSTMQVVATGEAQRVTVESDRLKELQFSIVVPSVRLWAPETPNLYMLRQRTYRGAELLDETLVHVGFRSLEAREGKVYLNGKEVFLKALTYMEDAPRGGRTLSVDEMERDILMIKNLGANALRLAAGSAHPYLMSLCDRYGIMVLLDLPLSQVTTDVLRYNGVLTTAKNTLREVLSRDNARPSLVALGYAQGVAGGDAGILRRYFTELRSSLRFADHLLHYASFVTAPEAATVAELDVLGFDVPPMHSEQAEAWVNTLPFGQLGKPVLLSSLCYPVQIGNYNGYSDPRSIDAQGQYFLLLYRAARNKAAAGFIVHSFADWAVSRPIMSVDRVHQFTATAGIVDRYRQKRIVYDVLKSSFNNEKPPVLVSGALEEEHPVSFVVVGILVIFLFALVYNLFRRFRENVVRSLMRPYNFYADVRDQRMLSIFQTSMVGVLGSLAAGLLFANVLFFWRDNMFVDMVLSQFVRGNGLKQWINFSAWNPLENMLVLALLLFLTLLILTFILRLVAFVARRKVLLFDAYSVTMWSVLPMIVISPLGMVLYRMMNVPVLEVLAVLVYVVFHIWIISRLLKGTAIVFDVRPVFFYLGGYVLLAAGLVFWLLSLDRDFAVFAYLRHFANIWLATAGISS